jgi:hypothetical protein
MWLRQMEHISANLWHRCFATTELEMFEDTKEIGKLKNYIQYNGQRKGIKGQIIIHKRLHRK